MPLADLNEAEIRGGWDTTLAFGSQAVFLSLATDRSAVLKIHEIYILLVSGPFWYGVLVAWCSVVCARVLTLVAPGS